MVHEWNGQQKAFKFSDDANVDQQPAVGTTTRIRYRVDQSR